MKRNAEAADQFQAPDLKSPRKSFEIMPYVVVGTRGAVSVVTLGAAVAGATSMDFGPLQQLLTDIWTHTVSLIPGLNENDATMVASLHGGGPAAALSSYIHGGGPAA